MDSDSRFYRGRTVRSVSPAPSPRSFVPSRGESPAPPRRRSSMNRKIMALMNRYESGEIENDDDAKPSEKVESLLETKDDNDQVAQTDKVNDDQPEGRTLTKIRAETKDSRPCEASWTKKPTEDGQNHTDLEGTKGRDESERIEDSRIPVKLRKVNSVVRDEAPSKKKEMTAPWMTQLKDAAGDRAPQKAKIPPIKKNEETSPWMVQLKKVASDRAAENTKNPPIQKKDKATPLTTQLKDVASEAETTTIPSTHPKEKAAPWTKQLKSTTKDSASKGEKSSGAVKNESRAPWIKGNSEVTNESTSSSTREGKLSPTSKIDPSSQGMNKNILNSSSEKATTKVSWEVRKEKAAPSWVKGNDQERVVREQAGRLSPRKKKRVVTRVAKQRQQPADDKKPSSTRQASPKRKEIEVPWMKKGDHEAGKDLPKKVFRPKRKEKSLPWAKNQTMDIAESSEAVEPGKQAQRSQLKKNQSQESGLNGKSEVEATTVSTVTADSTTEEQKDEISDVLPHLQSEEKLTLQDPLGQSGTSGDGSEERAGSEGVADNQAVQGSEYECSETNLGSGESYEVSYREVDDDDDDDDAEEDGEDLCSSSEEGVFDPERIQRTRSNQDSIVSTASFTLSLGSCDEVSSLEAEFEDEEEIEEEYSIDDISVSEDEREVVEIQKNVAEIELRKMFSKATLSFDPDGSEVEELTEMGEDEDFPGSQLSPEGRVTSRVSDSKAGAGTMATLSPISKRRSPTRPSRRMSEVSTVSEYSEYVIDDSEADFDIEEEVEEELEEELEEEFDDDVEEEIIEEEFTEEDTAQEDDIDGSPVQVTAA